MNKLLGNKADVHLKQDGEIISGIIFDVDEEHVYIQKDVSIVITIPKDNIKYYASLKSEPVAEVMQATPTNHTPTQIQQPDVITQQLGDKSLRVFVDGELIADIPVADHLDVTKYSQNIMKIALSHSEVQDYLVGKVQTAAEFTPGSLYIMTSMAKQTGAPGQSFEMSGGNWSEQYLSPTETVSRLTEAINGIKKQKETK